jgi:histone H1/5
MLHFGSSLHRFCADFKQQSFSMTYKAGIVDAISELKDRTGSSMIAIKKLMMSKFPADKKW